MSEVFLFKPIVLTLLIALEDSLDANLVGAPHTWPSWLIAVWPSLAKPNQTPARFTHPRRIHPLVGIVQAKAVGDLFPQS